MCLKHKQLQLTAFDAYGIQSHTVIFRDGYEALNANNPQLCQSGLNECYDEKNFKCDTNAKNRRALEDALNRPPNRCRLKKCLIVKVIYSKPNSIWLKSNAAARHFALTGRHVCNGKSIPVQTCL